MCHGSSSSMGGRGRGRSRSRSRGRKSTRTRGRKSTRRLTYRSLARARALRSGRKGPAESATLYKVGTKRRGLDGNTWIIIRASNGVQRWKLNRRKRTCSRASCRGRGCRSCRYK